MWFIEDLSRFYAENQCVAELDRAVDWLEDVQWLIEATSALLECDILIGERRFPIRVSFPAGYPASPPAVIPRNKEHWSDHQYGTSGDLCLELGPDNWHPDHHNAADILRSAEKLLRLERDHASDPTTVIPSRHEITTGQDIRLERLRFAMTERTHELLQGLRDSDCVSGTVVTCFHADTTAVTFLVRAQVNEEAWTDSHIPAKTLAHAGLEQLLWILPQRHGALAWSDMHTHDGLRGAVDRHAVRVTGDIPKYVLARNTVGEWKLFRYWEDGSSPTCYVPITVQADSVQHRTGLDVDQLGARQVAVVGLGSMGSRVALSLARSGVRRFLLIDDDFIQPVNLVRHDADWHAVGVHKVDHVAQRLRALGPDINVDVRRHHLGGQESASSAGTAVRSLIESDLIIDATAIPQVFNFIGQIARRSKTTMIWMETFAGGIGGLIARTRPERDADPFTLRAALNAYCEEHPDPEARIQNYAVQSEGDEWMVATDADVNVIAHHAAILALDTLIERAPSDFDSPLYLIGLKRDWIFRAPFHTIPLTCPDRGQWGADKIAPERVGAAVESLKQALGNTAARDAGASN